ncbi:MAG: hypothetical protein Q4C96_06700 [Planctomycetia bacterium]|nr:hypothetical protein [Planctomycetia bacterium]
MIKIHCSTFLLAALILGIPAAFTGCRSASGEGTSANPWTRPAVILSKKEKGEKLSTPAEKADPKVISQLAHQRAGGKNTTTHMPDNSFRPNDAEIAQISQYKENESMPEWLREDSVPPPMTATSGEKLVNTAPAHPGAMNEVNPPVTSLGLDVPSDFPSVNGMSAPPATSQVTASGQDYRLPDVLDLPPLHASETQNMASTEPVTSGIVPNYPRTGSQSSVQAENINLPDINSLPAEHMPIIPENPLLENVSVPEPVTPKVPTVNFAPGNINQNYPARPGM